MKRQIVMLAALLPVQCLIGQGTAFTYQGALFNGSAPANGIYDFQLIAYDSSVAGNPVGTAYDASTAVTNGLFVLTPDFGPIFTNTSRWLDISVRAHGSSAYAELSPRQEILPVPSAVYSTAAGAAASATTATSFSGGLLGDVTGSQNAAVVFKVGGQLAADIARGVSAANGAASSNAPGALVARDASGNFAAATVTANFAGNGAGLTGILAGNLSSGTLADARLSTNVPLLDASQTFTGVDTFENTLRVSNLFVSGLMASNLGGNGGALVGVNADTLGTNELSAVNGQAGLGLGTNLYMNNHPVFLGADQNHGLAYNGNGVTNFPSSAVQPDGPVLWGFTGGALGVLNGGPQAALSWNNSGVNVFSNLTANNTPGVNFSQGYLGNGSSAQIPIPNNGATGVQLDSCANGQPATGFFVVMANAWVSDNGNNIGLQLYDATGGNLLAQTQQYANADLTMSSVNDLNLSLTYVFGIAAASGPETFATVITANGPGSLVLGHNLTVMYFPRQN